MSYESDLRPKKGAERMQPVFAHNLLFAVVLVASMIIWRVIESIVDFLSYRRLSKGARRQDGGSVLVLIASIAPGAFLGVVLAFKVPGAAIPFARVFIFWLGIALIYVGIAFRLYAIHTLGAYFTTRVATTQGQTIIESGPYRLIRHPSYTGMLIILLGLALAFTNWLSLLFIMAGGLIGLGYRIHVEERVLQEKFGQQYQDYMRRTKRLIPFVV